MKKIIVLCLSLIIAFSSVLPVFAGYTELIDSEIDKTVKSGSNSFYSENLKSEKVIMMSLDDMSTVLYEKNSEVREDPASLVKMIVGILALREAPDLKAKVTVKQSSLDEIAGTGWGILNLYADEQITVEDLIYSTVMGNCNDSCFVLADEVLGGKEACVEKMNKYAETLGCENTHFTNINGSDDAGQYTTVKDMLTIYLDCLQDGTFKALLSTNVYEVEPTEKYYGTRTATTTYLPLTSGGYSNEYATGGRYAATVNDTGNVVCTSSYGGFNYVIVILGSPVEYRNDTTYKYAFIDSNKLFTWVHSNIKLKTIATKDDYCGEMKVKYSSKYDYVGLSPEDDVRLLVPKNTTPSSFIYEIDEKYKTEGYKKNIKKGDFLCTAKIKYADMEIGEVNLVAAYDVTKNPIKIITSKVGSFTQSVFFEILVCAVIAAAFIFAIIIIIKTKTKNRENFMQSRSNSKSRRKGNK